MEEAPEVRRRGRHQPNRERLARADTALLWLPRVIHYPQLFGTWSGFAEEFALVVAASVAWVASAPRTSAWALELAEACRVLFGICVVIFAVEHFTALGETARMVPAWLPPGQRFWAMFTGIAHLLAGIAIVSGMRALLAARLLTAMFLTFSALVWLPRLFAAPTNHIAWAGNAINLAMVGATWIVADWLGARAHDAAATRADRARQQGGARMPRSATLAAASILRTSRGE